MIFTHSGLHNSNLWKQPVKVKLRETKMYWITENGRRYKKKNGYQPGVYVRSASSSYLILNTVQPL